MSGAKIPFYISSRFEEVVSSHIIMNLIEIPFLNPPLILGIHGPAGEGKTLQCQIIFDRMGINVELLHGEQFENENAGVPVRMIKQQYKNAAKNNSSVRQSYRKTKLPPSYHSYRKEKSAPEKFTILFINDLDVRIGRSDGLIQQTVNTQLINAFLMELADNPTSIDGEQLSRVPIIATGNNFGTLYQPLIRDGRMEKFEWIPTLEEKIQVVRRIFPEESLSNTDIRNLVSELSQAGQKKHKNTQTINMPISSYAMLRYYIYRKEAIKIINKVGLESIVEYVLSGEHISVLRHPYFTIDAVRKVAYELIENGTLLNHLEV